MFAPRPVDDPTPPLPGPVGAATGLPCGVAAVAVTWALGGDPAIGLALAVVAAVLIGARTTVPGAVVGAALCWACYDGFVVNRFAVLGGSRGELAALASLAAVAVGASAVRALIARGYPARGQLTAPVAGLA